MFVHCTIVDLAAIARTSAAVSSSPPRRNINVSLHFNSSFGPGPDIRSPQRK